jgi:hypothetical protein
VAVSSNPRPGIIGRWATLPETERTARLRSLAAVVKLIGGWPYRPLVERIRRAETDPSLLPAIDTEFNKMPTLTMRRILAELAA